MLRMLRSGGPIGMANLTSEGLIGELFRIVGRHVPPPLGIASPALWGGEPYVVALFGPRAADVRRVFNFRYRSRRTGSRCSATSTAPRTKRSRRSTSMALLGSSST